MTPFSSGVSSGAYLLRRGTNLRVDSGSSSAPATTTIATINLSSVPFTVTTSNILVAFSEYNMSNLTTEFNEGWMTVVKSIANNILTVRCKFTSVTGQLGYATWITYAIYAVPSITDLTA